MEEGERGQIAASTAREDVLEVAVFEHVITHHRAGVERAIAATGPASRAPDLLAGLTVRS